MNLNTPTTRRFFPTVRLIRGLLWSAFSAVLAFVAFAIAVPWLRNGTTIMAVFGVIAGVAAIVFGILRVPANPWARLGVSYAVIGCFLGYLVVDDATIRLPLTVDSMSPEFPGAEDSYGVLMRYGKKHPLGRDFQFKPSPHLSKGGVGWKPADPSWSGWLTTNRTELETGWAKLEPVRAWWAELNSFERIGDLTPPDFQAEIIGYMPVRTLAQHACAIASLQAIDGNGDAAFETLLPIFEVGRKLEPSARTLVRVMIARAVQKLTLETALFVLDTAPVSSELRDRISVGLSGGSEGAAGVRRLVSIEYAFLSDVMTSAAFRRSLLHSDQSPFISQCLRTLSAFVINPRRTLNTYGELTLELQNLAVQRRVSDIEIQDKIRPSFQGADLFKNSGGVGFISMIKPNYKTIVDVYWKTEDLRSALRERLLAR